MKGLVFKDFLAIIKQRRIQLIAISCFLMMMVLIKEMNPFLLYIPMLLSTMVVNCIHIDEQSRFQNYAETMPVSSKQVVAAKYLFMLLLAVLGMVICSVFGSVIFEMNDLLTWKNVLLLAAGSMMMITILGSLSIPLCLWLGSSIGTFFYLFLTGILAGLFGVAVTKLEISLSEIAQQSIEILTNPVPWVLLGIICTALLTSLSYLIAFRLYQRKEN